MFESEVGIVLMQFGFLRQVALPIERPSIAHLLESERSSIAEFFVTETLLLGNQ